MRSTSNGFRFTAIVMTLLMFVVAGPYQAATAALIPTEAAGGSADAANARETVKKFLSREDAQGYLVAKGVDPDEAKARIDSLTDAEALMLSKQIENLPAGGNGVAIVVGAILLVFIILLITDLLGLTNVFPFVKKHR